MSAVNGAPLRQVARALSASAWKNTVQIVAATICRAPFGTKAIALRMLNREAERGHQIVVLAHLERAVSVVRVHVGHSRAVGHGASTS